MNRLLKSIVSLSLIVILFAGCENIDAAKEELHTYETLDIDDLRATEDTENYYEEDTEDYYEVTVYVSRTGKIHKRSNCSGMKYYIEMDQDAAINSGYNYCKKCY